MAEYIDRNDALAIVRYAQDKEAGILNLPAADVAPVVHGRWNAWCGEHLWQECSVCGYRVQYSYSRDCKYCPNCGANMKDGDTNA